jgi:uncharacterized phage protein gp47/JayE
MAAQLSLSTLLGTATLDAWKATIISVAARVGLKTENWAEGGYTRTLVALFAELYTTAGDVVRLIAASGFLDYAEGDWLTLLARNMFGVERIQATYAAAAGGITLTNTGGGLYVFDPGDLVVAKTSPQATYRNTSGGTLSPGGGPLTLDLMAEEPGSNSNAGPNTIVELVTTALGVTVTNHVALAGLDEETDEALRDRCRDSLAALSVGGIKKAYEFFAKSALLPDGTPVGATRVRVMPAAGDGTLTVYVAGPSGEMTGPLVAAVQMTFDTKVTPYGLDATAVSATNLSVAAPATIWIPASLGISTADARLIVWKALNQFVQTLPIGGTIITPETGKVYWRALLAVIANAIPGTLHAQLTAEADIDVTDGQVPIWDGASPDITVMQVP